mmetsp:Transcript_26709/g.41654  ORF Transcript_26709/g.41654 Transcript_26709/m.41654 type:complete len:141 (-) Transcript_26709:102-524(-)
MSRCGVPTLQSLRILYSRRGGSSLGTREYLEKKFPEFQEKYPHVQSDSRSVGNHHPFLYARYTKPFLNRKGKPTPFVIPLRNKSAAEVEEHVNQLRSQWGSGKKDRTVRKYTRNYSVQGMWTPLSPLDDRQQVTSPMKFD